METQHTVNVLQPPDDKQTECWNSSQDIDLSMPHGLTRSSQKHKE